MILRRGAAGVAARTGAEQRADAGVNILLAVGCEIRSQADLSRVRAFLPAVFIIIIQF